MKNPQARAILFCAKSRSVFARKVLFRVPSPLSFPNRINAVLLSACSVPHHGEIVLLATEESHLVYSKVKEIGNDSPRVCPCFRSSTDEYNF